MRELTDIDVIRDVLGRHGFHFSKSKGQNFLTAAWVPEEIVERAGLDENTGVLEIGPGLGSLTVKLSEAAGKVLAVELDETLMPVLAETLQGCENTEVLFGNILKKDVAQLVEENFQGLRPVVCANLPYNVTSPVLAQLLESRAFRQITVMVQKEVAQRICAGAGNKEYSAVPVVCRTGAALRCVTGLFHPTSESDLQRAPADHKAVSAGAGAGRETVFPNRPRGIQSAPQDSAQRPGIRGGGVYQAGTAKNHY